MAALSGRFVVFDGPDGSGKSTQFRRFVSLARESGVRVTEVREPGGTHVGERIREILLDPIHEEMTLRCEMMLYMASRAQLVEEAILPALARGELVMADRYVSSTLAYQGAAGGLPIDEIMSVARAACAQAWPDLVVVFDVDEETAAGRLNPLLDRMEQKGAAFHRKVREGYLAQVRRDPKGYALVDARAEEDTVFMATLEAIRAKLGAGGIRTRCGA
jgi:dTMP kinase